MTGSELVLQAGTQDGTSARERDPFERRIARGDLFFLGESYISGAWSPENLHAEVTRAINCASSKTILLQPKILALLFKDRFLNRQRGGGAFEIAERHYDLGNDLFGVMLDSTKSYTCAYWEGARTLEEAQRAKLDLICRKLKLEPGMSVLDIGCGWGNFAEHAARNYGVRVEGVTVSKEQAAYAAKRCENMDVSIRLQDYGELTGKFDRVVSIEMIEAVGRKNLRRYFDKVGSVLEDDGLFLLQSISGETFTKASHPGLDSFIAYLLKYIFPNGYLPRMESLIAPPGGALSVKDVHDISTDYIHTLSAWHANFHAGWDRISFRYSEELKRMWTFYLEGCRACFENRLVHVHQVVYTKAQSSGQYQPLR